MLRCPTSSKLSACSCSVMGFHKLHVLSWFIAHLPLLCLIYSSNTVASKNQNCQISNIDKMMPSCLMFASSLKCPMWQRVEHQPGFASILWHVKGHLLDDLFWTGVEINLKDRMGSLEMLCGECSSWTRASSLGFWKSVLNSIEASLSPFFPLNSEISLLKNAFRNADVRWAVRLPAIVSFTTREIRLWASGPTQCFCHDMYGKLVVLTSFALAIRLEDEVLPS